MSAASAYTTFATAIGACAIAWSEHGVVALQLPEASERATRARLLRGLGATIEADPPTPVRDAVTAVVALLDGAAIDLGDVALDETGIAPFNRRVYAVARRIGPGETRTYGEVAAALGEPTAARAVGRALGENPFAIIVPCHRVLAAGGRIGGFSAGGGAATKRRILAIERARIGDEPDLFAAEARPPASSLAAATQERRRLADRIVGTPR